MKVLAQRVTSASDTFNLLTYGDTMFDSKTIKNMYSLSELKKKIEEFLWFCKQRTLKLKTSKFVISEEVEFAGSFFFGKTGKGG